MRKEFSLVLSTTALQTLHQYLDVEEALFFTLLLAEAKMPEQRSTLTRTKSEAFLKYFYARIPT